MPHIKKYGKIYHVFWYENGKHHSKAVSPDLAATAWQGKKRRKQPERYATYRKLFG
jgi:hypothetical protein